MSNPAESPSTAQAGTSAWLLLFYQLPAKHSPARVKAWRRLQRIGAITLKNSAYVLPNSGEAREDFEWIKTEIIAIGGQATVLGAEALDSAVHQEIIDLFRAARAQDFDTIREEAQAMLERWQSRRPGGPARRRLAQSVRRLRERFREIEVIDFFDAHRRSETAQVLDDLDRRASRGNTEMTRATASKERLDVEDYRGRVWVTRPRPGVDRMASAWLIRRFIDPRAKFTFDNVTNRSTVIPFDMFGAEFGHHGTSSTFETIAQRFGINDPTVAWLGRIVHDLDLKQDKSGVPETPVVGRMIEGLRRIYNDDQTLLSEGITMFEALYQSYGGRKPKAASSPSPPKRAKSRRTRRGGRT